VKPEKELPTWKEALERLDPNDPYSVEHIERIRADRILNIQPTSEEKRMGKMTNDEAYASLGKETGVRLSGDLTDDIFDDIFDAEFGPERAIKETSGKLRFDLIPPEAMVEIAKVYTDGAEKYSARNWEKGLSMDECIGALERHFSRFKLGQDVNPNTGSHEAAHMAFWCMAIISQYHRGISIEDSRKERKVNLEKLKAFLES